MSTSVVQLIRRCFYGTIEIELRRLDEQAGTALYSSANMAEGMKELEIRRYR